VPRYGFIVICIGGTDSRRCHSRSTDVEFAQVNVSGLHEMGQICADDKGACLSAINTEQASRHVACRDANGLYVRSHSSAYPEIAANQAA